MSALAKYFVIRGKHVTGSDLHASDITKDLQQHQVQFYQEHHADHLSDSVELVIHSPAVPTTNPEYVRAQELGIPVMSYPQALGELSKHYSTIVVTGTHGKSTTTAMLGLILEAAGYDPTVIVGSLVPSFEHGNVRVGNGRFLVIEGCEHQANMLNLHPEMIVLTSIEADHLDYYKTLENVRAAFQTFVDRLNGTGMVVVNADDLVSQTLQIVHAISYGTKTSAHYHYRQREVGDGLQTALLYRMVPEEHLGSLELRVPGSFNMANALAAVSAAMELGIPFEICARTLSKFSGIWRRFERVGTYRGTDVISDYGHHPTAVRVTLEAAREFFPNKKILLCFQPHQHARTEALFDEFVEALSGADGLVVPEIYRVEGRTENETVSSLRLVEAIQKRRPELRVHHAQTFEDAEALLERLSEQEPDCVIVIQGAGSIDELARKMTKT